MEAYKKEFIEFMVESEVLKFGDFTLKSGRKSPFFMNAQPCFLNYCGKYYYFGSKRSAKCADAGTEMDFAVRMLYLADVPDYVLYSTANEQG
mgnify:CR=1 FL=1